MTTEEDVQLELEHQQARVDKLRAQREEITYDLQWAIREVERLRRHTALPKDKGEEG